MQLEALCIQLGIPQHIPALSEFRDNLIRENASALQALRAELTPSTPEPSTLEPSGVPAFVRTAQLRQWLVARNAAENLTLLDAVEAKLTNPAEWPSSLEMRKAQIRWEFEPNVNRADPLVIALGHNLGMDDAALDAAFTEISQIQ
jgi:hypothetical protein